MSRAVLRILIALLFVLLARQASDCALAQGTTPAPVAATAPATTPSTAPSFPPPVIHVERVEPTVQRIVIDPAHPPPKMPRMHPGEAALTQYYFDCAVRVRYEIVRSQLLSDGRIQITAQVHLARVKLTLDDR